MPTNTKWHPLTSDIYWLSGFGSSLLSPRKRAPEQHNGQTSEPHGTTDFSHWTHSAHAEPGCATSVVWYGPTRILFRYLPGIISSAMLSLKRLQWPCDVFRTGHWSSSCNDNRRLWNPSGCRPPVWRPGRSCLCGFYNLYSRKHESLRISFPN